jgi:hypothetical protein
VSFMEPHVFGNDVTFLFKFLYQKIEGSYFLIQADFLFLQHRKHLPREVLAVDFFGVHAKGV